MTSLSHSNMVDHSNTNPSSRTDSPRMQDQELSPLMRQYRTVKAQQPEAILFFRVGDFYEMFFEDAEEAAGILGIVLTARGKARGPLFPSVEYHTTPQPGTLRNSSKPGKSLPFASRLKTRRRRKDSFDAKLFASTLPAPCMTMNCSQLEKPTIFLQSFTRESLLLKTPYPNHVWAWPHWIFQQANLDF